MSAEDPSGLRNAAPYERIYALVGQIPEGRLASYGQIAALEGHSTPRMVGYALAALDSRRDVPWQRVINSQGTVSERRQGGGTSRQRRALEAEGVVFDSGGRVDFHIYGWAGPDWEWLDAHGYFPAPPPGRPRGRKDR
jgi:methylated-DNA-protein-cysteine methyltransferase-like protein